MGDRRHPPLAASRTATRPRAAASGLSGAATKERSAREDGASRGPRPARAKRAQSSRASARGTAGPVGLNPRAARCLCRGLHRSLFHGRCRLDSGCDATGGAPEPTTRDEPEVHPRPVPADVATRVARRHQRTEPGAHCASPVSTAAPPVRDAGTQPSVRHRTDQAGDYQEKRQQTTTVTFCRRSASRSR